jgi:SHS2 domain-containing protein
MEREREEAETRRGPSEENERRIDALIEQRKKTMEQSAANAPHEEEPEVLNDLNYEYLDHTADIQLHGWGDSLERALEQVGIAMFGYMTSLGRIEMNKEQSDEHASGIEIKGHDLLSLVFNFLQEWLYVFHATGFVAKEMTIQPIDRETLSVFSSAKGELADWNRHTQGTEVKAVTYSHLQVKEADDRCDIWVIVDI